MRLILLGTAGYHPNDRRQTQCLLLPDCGVMLDAGTGLYRATEYLRTAELDIYLTHAHLDHTIGLTYLLSVQRLHPLRRITVHGLPEKLAVVRDHLFSEGLFPVAPPFELRPLVGEERLPGGGKLMHFSLEHRGGSVGFRLDWPGHSLAYVTDTTAALEADYVAKIRGVDLLVHECYFADEQAELAKQFAHSSTSAVATVAREAGVKRLVMAHVCPMLPGDDPLGLARARAIFPATSLGEDRMELEF